MINVLNEKAEFIKDYESIELASFEMNITKEYITNCLNGLVTEPDEYFFSYKNRDDAGIDKYVIEIGDEFIYNKYKYKLVSRDELNSTVSAVRLECIDSRLIHSNKRENISEEEIGINTEISISYDAFKILGYKDTSDSALIELYLYMKSISDDFVLNIEHSYIESSKLNMIIYFNKLYKNCEVLLGKKGIMERIDPDRVVINIFEDRWYVKKEIIKSRLSNASNNSKRIYGRKCIVKEISDTSEIRDFLDANHLQGYIRSRYKYGLYYNDELVAVAVYGTLRINMGQKSKDGYYELLRYCSKMHTNVIGGASKLIKAFTKDVETECLISYADRSWGEGNLYEKLKFEESDKKVNPSYFYIIDGKRENRFAHRKDILVKLGYDKDMTEVGIQESRGYFRIFDCGAKGYNLYTNKNI